MVKRHSRKHSILQSHELVPHGYHYLPNTLKIMGHTWKLGGVSDFVDRLYDKFTDGICDTLAMEIAIRPGMPPSVVKETLLHEIIEALNAMMELGLDHSTIQLLGLGLYQVMSDNGLFGLCTSWFDLPASARQIIQQAYHLAGGVYFDPKIFRQTIEWYWPEAFPPKTDTDEEMKDGQLRQPACSHQL